MGRLLATGNESDLKLFLDEKSALYHQKWFIADDPISIPRRFSRKEDIEISAFLTSTISWGQRVAIVKKAGVLMGMMDNAPFDFITSLSSKEMSRFGQFVYRTFNGNDCIYFITALHEIYTSHNGLESLFTDGLVKGSVKDALASFRELFMSFSPMQRTGKHVADVTRNSSAKRLNMFLRWMVRDNGDVDFGLWKGIKPADLMIPLDVHVGRVARKLGLLTREQDDWKAVEELTAALRLFNPHDPVYYDYALFGLGVHEKF